MSSQTATLNNDQFAGAGAVKKAAAVAVNPWLIAITVALATFMEVLDTSIANVALQNISGYFSAGREESNWVLTGYLVANAVVLPISGWLATIIGRKKFFIICLATFTMSSLLCGLAPNIELLILFRILQGMSGAGMLPAGQAVLADSFPPEKLGTAFAVYGMAIVFAPAIGPALGGWLTDNLSWHWVFLINVPVGLVAIFASWRLISDPPELVAERTRKLKNGLRIDYVGIILLAAGLGSLQMVLEEGNTKDWFDSKFIVFFAVIAVFSLCSALIWELVHPEPVIDLRLFSVRNYALANSVMFMLGIVFFATTTMMPLFAQTMLGYTATLAGLMMTPGGFLIMVLMPMVGILISKVDVRYLIGLGIILTSFGIYHTTGLTTEADFNTLVWARILQSSGLAFLFVPINTAAYVGVPKSKGNEVAVMLNLMRNLGGGLGIAMATTLYARQAQYHQSVLVTHITDYNPSSYTMLQNLTRSFVAQGSSFIEAKQQALQALYGMVLKQAYMLSFNDVFLLLAIAFISSLPLVLLMKKNKPGEGGGAAAH
jgi:MFS transporter, DHA2 family, multidrug resistance protein